MSILTHHLCNQIIQFTEDALHKTNVPSAALALVENDETICLQTFGKTSENTLFPIASITKSYTAASIGLLVEKGLLSWNDKVIQHIPNFCFYDSTIASTMEIHDLLTHSTGLYEGALEQMATWGYPRQSLQRGLPYVQPVAPFRGQYAYNNVPYLWVEDLFLNLTGETWGHFVDQHMFRPLGLTNTYVGKKNVNLNQLVQGYILDEETRSQLTPISFSNYAETFLTAGGLVSTIADVANWVKVLMGAVPFLSPETRQQLMTPYTHIDDKFSYCLGLRLRKNLPFSVYSHGGLIQGVRHQMVFVPDIKVGMVLLTNLTHSQASSLVVDYFCETVMGIANIKAAPIPPVSSEPKTWLPKKHLGKATNIDGNYNNVILGDVSIKGDLLTFCETNAQACLTPISETEFSLYFLGKAGAVLGEGHWGTLHYQNDHLIMKGYPNFSSEQFMLDQIHQD